MLRSDKAKRAKLLGRGIIGGPHPSWAFKSPSIVIRISAIFPPNSLNMYDTTDSMIVPCFLSFLLVALHPGLRQEMLQLCV